MADCAGSFAECPGAVGQKLMREDDGLSCGTHVGRCHFSHVVFLILQFAEVKLFIAIVCRCKENGGWEGRLE